MVFHGKKKDMQLSSDTIKTGDLERLKEQLDDAYANLNYVVEPMLIDSWIYEIKAASLRYEFYLNQLKRTPS